mmetsp:Transcript_1873/g.5453  ORF Transcript_1873/g.5453 Transcript_1873/m.5453 type:complete len:367 (+) Transcript_1873:11-1111(+)
MLTINGEMASATETASFSIYTGPESETRVSSKRRSVALQPDALTQLQADVAQKVQTKKNDSDAIYYFGTGPIVNPLVRKRRGVKMSGERAAILSEYRITFAVGGIANVVPGRGCEVHGVVMKFDTKEGWEEYKKMNAGNDDIRPVDVYTYADPDTPIRAYVFVMEGKDIDKDAPMEQPAEERYLRLIADGLKLHGVDEDYIEFTIMSNEYVPSRKPGDYHKFPSKSKVRKITRSKYEAICRDVTDKYYFVLGDIVCEMPVSNPENPGAKWIRGQCHGKGDMSWIIYKIRIDPDIPEIECREDLTPQHIEWAESMTYEYLSKCNLSATKCYQIVESSGQDGGGGANGGILAILCCRGSSVQVVQKGA